MFIYTHSVLSKLFSTLEKCTGYTLSLYTTHMFEPQMNIATVVRAISACTVGCTNSTAHISACTCIYNTNYIQYINLLNITNSTYVE